jgi:hypothetical protein
MIDKGSKYDSRSVRIALFLSGALLLSIACSFLGVTAEHATVPDESPTLAVLATRDTQVNIHLGTKELPQATLVNPPLLTLTGAPRPTATPPITSIETSQPLSPPTTTGQLTPTATLPPDVAPRIIAFSGSPTPVDPTDVITLSWVVRGASSVTIGWIDKNAENMARSHLPPVGSLSVPLSDVKFTGGDHVHFKISAYGASGLLLVGEDGNPISEQTIVPLQTDVEIHSFHADPALVERGGSVTLSWEVSNALNVGITRLSPEGVFLATEGLDLPPKGAITLSIPEKYATSVRYYLGARDVNGVLRGAYLSVDIICPYEEHLAFECPLTRSHVWAAYQPFEGGYMVWRSDIREIYVLYSDGDYETYADIWQEGASVAIADTPPQGLQAPVRGFGKLWANQPDVREKLGWAIAVESGYTMAVETISGGSGRYPGTSTWFTLPDNRVVTLYPFSSTWQLRSLEERDS